MLVSRSSSRSVNFNIAFPQKSGEVLVDDSSLLNGSWSWKDTCFVQPKKVVYVDIGEHTLLDIFLNFFLAQTYQRVQFNVVIQAIAAEGRPHRGCTPTTHKCSYRNDILHE